MPRLILIPVLALILCARLCPAAEDEAPQTGTIEVEVVYKDTGEPVEKVFVLVYVAEEVESADGSVFPVARAVALLPGTGRIAFGGLVFDTYQVLISPSASVSFGGLGFRWDDALRFCPSLSECERQITLSADSPTAEVRFAVERGCKIEGVVRRTGGSTVSGATVRACWEANEEIYSSLCRTDSDGRYQLTGLAPGGVVHLVVLGPYPVSGSGTESDSWGELWRDDVLVAGEGSPVDIDLDTASLEVMLDIVVPLWPFSRGGERSVEAVGFVVGDQEELSAWGPDLVKLGTPMRAASHVLPKDRHVFTITDLPRGERIALAVGVAPPRETGFGRPTWGFHRSVQLRDERQSVRLTVYEPGARASYCFWFAVVAIIVLAICVPILVRHVRRRKQESTTDLHG